MTAATQKFEMMQAQTCVSKCECRIHQFSRGQALLQMIDCRTRKHTMDQAHAQPQINSRVSRHMAGKLHAWKCILARHHGSKTIGIPVHWNAG